MGNTSAHQNIPRNMISGLAFILISNYADSKFVSYLCIRSKCGFAAKFHLYRKYGLLFFCHFDKLPNQQTRVHQRLYKEIKESRGGAPHFPHPERGSPEVWWATHPSTGGESQVGVDSYLSN